jgi:hypothetical protein
LMKPWLLCWRCELVARLMEASTGDLSRGAVAVWCCECCRATAGRMDNMFPSSVCQYDNRVCQYSVCNRLSTTLAPQKSGITLLLSACPL